MAPLLLRRMIVLYIWGMKEWKKIFDLAHEFYQLKPWNWMEETDIFGIKITGDDDIYFASVMGAEEEHPSIALYQGWNALANFWELQDCDPELAPDILLTTPHYLISFSEKDMLDSKMQMICRSINYQPINDEAWPDLKKIIPGLFPISLKEEESSKIAAMLEQILEIVKRARVNKTFIHGVMHDDETYLVRESVTIGTLRYWEDRYERMAVSSVIYKCSITQEKLNKVLGFQEKVEIEVDLRIMPTPVKGKNEPVYFPLCLICIDAENGLVHGFNILKPLPTLDDLYGRLPAELLEILIKAEICPELIMVRNKFVDTVFQNMFAKRGIDVMFLEDLPQTDAALIDLYKFIK